MQILALLRSRFQFALSDLADNPGELSELVAPARDARHGDYQANVAMPLGKRLGRPPREVASEILDRLDVEDICLHPEVAGPGFINLRLKDEFLTQQLSKLIADDRAGVESTPPRTFVIDYSSPNVAKPMHVGHIRSTVIGDALARILRFLGHKVITDNHLGDWGTQFGMIIYGYKQFADMSAYESGPVAELSRIYRVIQAIIGYQSASTKIEQAHELVDKAQEKIGEVEASVADEKNRKKELKTANRSLRSAQENLQALQAKISIVREDAELLEAANAHPELQARCQNETVKLHEGDVENVALWNKFMPIAYDVINRVYELLDIKFDYTLGESFYHPMLSNVVKRLLDDGLAQEDNGAICLFVDGFDAPMIVQKSDGAFLYATTDIATIEYRMQEFSPDAILYVVDHRQGEHFDKLFAAVEMCGVKDVELTHVSFGTVLGPDGKPFKTRSGTVVGLEHLLSEAVDRAHQVVCAPQRLEKSGIDMPQEEKQNVANVVGLGAIKYADLSHNRTSDYEFDTEKMVQLEGNTSAYIQYMYARSQSILRRAGVPMDAQTAATTKIELTHTAERALLLQLLQFEDTLCQTVDGYFPNILTSYLYAVAKNFASFFDQCHVLGAEEESLRMSRLAICFATGKTLKLGLSLLGIGVVERM